MYQICGGYLWKPSSLVVERLALNCAEQSRGSVVVPLAYGTLRERGSKLAS
ncbi:MAG: hypothetical protein RMY16_20040 [Nostoc sp. DedQUE12b]|uniref:hypothetical protein n=1 Tax=Nostoc sp. DedQUE12b TaxID=3075398 RepID=UPI002AD389D2|nr:hypothetical protein [Nostoc sp. DedQUE12b]MDZ8087834.1 hypothetical protein [Nostoc sp. DedQUE12b]